MRYSYVAVLLVFLCFSCATYYQVNDKFNGFFEGGEMEKAAKVLEANKKAESGKEKLLYHMNMGVVCAMQGAYEESNRYLEQAYLLSEDLRNNAWHTASALLVNPMLLHYTGEDHELLLIHYYKALNFLKLDDPQAALVECRRLHIRLNKISDQSQAGLMGAKGRYTRDAFIHTLMGLIYDASQDYNNAFIAYRNAVDIYQEDYQAMFGIQAPQQLKKDLLRTAYLMGFSTELQRYENLFDMHYEHQQQEGGELVFFWHDGLGPVKAEWGINFSLIRGAGGMLTFHNEDMGLNFPFFLGSDRAYEEKGLQRLEFIRVVFPKYVERPALFTQAHIETAGKRYRLEKAEDVNAIAFQSLQQRMFKEFSTSLLRVAIKKAAEYGVRQENGDLGALVGIVNALTEKADTRNWQTIPHTIYYARVPLPEGKQQLSMMLSSDKTTHTQTHHFTFDIVRNRTAFCSFQSLERAAYPLNIQQRIAGY